MKLLLLILAPLTLFLFCYFTSCNSTAEKSLTENKLERFKLHLRNADTILLVTHGQTYGPIFNKEDRSHREAERIVVNNTINKKLIDKTLLIEGEAREKLINVLSEEIKGPPIDIASCFDPHHALILIHKRKLSYLEFCFTCGGVATDSLEISSSDFDKEKWDKVYKYIDNKIPFED